MGRVGGQWRPIYGPGRGYSRRWRGRLSPGRAPGAGDVEVAGGYSLPPAGPLQPLPPISVSTAPPDAFDPDAPAEPGAGLFGLSSPKEECRVRVLGVPFDATTSYRKGAARGPAAVLAASHQVDLFDPAQARWPGGDGRPWAAGIHLEIDAQVEAWNREARPLAESVIEVGGRIEGRPELEAARARVDELGAAVDARVHGWTRLVLASGGLPVVLGGDHSVPSGAMRAAADAHPGLGLLHFDAHADLRVAYEGFTWSHASILHNVLDRNPDISRSLSVGLRDVGEREFEAVEASDGRIGVLWDHDWARHRAAGLDLGELARRELEPLPEELWLTIDVDGLDPALCPNTGTPVPGGLAWGEMMLWLEVLAESGKRVVGLDLCEVSPGEEPAADEDSWDAIVGARLLYKAIGAALAANSSGGRD